MQRLKRALTNALLFIFISALSFEALSALTILTGIFPARVPSYTVPSFKPFWIVESPDFGVWHAPNARQVHVTACYSIVYHSNSHGARDIERPLNDQKSRTIVLGDSFIEGFGLKNEDRLTNLLEERTGIPHLNFGSSGGVGPAQYFQIYRHLAKSFSHDGVIVGILPDNDFLDNDIEHARRHNDPNYRPFFVKQDEGYTLEFLNKSSLGTPERDKRRAFRQGLRNILRNFTFSANAIDYFKGMSKYWFADVPSAFAGKRGYSGYYDATEEQIHRVEFVIRKLVAEAAPRKVRIVLIPRLSDIATYKTLGPSELAQRFSKIAEVTDLLPVFARHQNPEKLYNQCDGHWSADANKLAAESLN